MVLARKLQRLLRDEASGRRASGCFGVAMSKCFAEVHFRARRMRALPGGNVPWAKWLSSAPDQGEEKTTPANSVLLR